MSLYSCIKAVFIYCRFSRVLPLPSENWQEICGNVFCHGDNTLPAGDALSPKIDDCFTSSSDYMLHSSVLENEIAEVWPIATVLCYMYVMAINAPICIMVYGRFNLTNQF